MQVARVDRVRYHDTLIEFVFSLDLDYTGENLSVVRSLTDPLSFNISINASRYIKYICT